MILWLLSSVHGLHSAGYFVQLLRNSGFVLRIKNLNIVYSLAFILLDDGVEQRPHIVGRRLVSKRGVGSHQINAMYTADKLRTFAANGNDMTFNVFCLVFLQAMR